MGTAGSVWPRAAAVVLAAVACSATAIPSADAAVRDDAQAVVSLFDDAGGQALFDGSVPISPSHPQVACIAVGASGAAAQDEVALLSRHVSGSLAPQLHLRVEIGAGGHAGDCSGFTGRAVWDGTLTELDRPSGVRLGWRPAADPLASFRLTASVDDSVSGPGRSAQADLVWRLVTSVPGTSPMTSGASSSPTPSGPSVASTPSPARVPARGAPGGETPDVVLQGRRSPADGLGGRMLATLLGVLATPQYPLATSGAAFLFLLVQEQVDRRDPKLMLAARRRRDTELVFPHRSELTPRLGGAR